MKIETRNGAITRASWGVESKITSAQKWSDASPRKAGESFDALRHLSEFRSPGSLSVHHVADLVLRILVKTVEDLA